MLFHFELVQAPQLESFYNKSTVNSAVHPSEVGKCVLRSDSEDEHWTHIDNSLSKVEVFHPL